jgi:hypothetical protein
MTVAVEIAIGDRRGRDCTEHEGHDERAEQSQFLDHVSPSHMKPVAVSPGLV